MKPKLVKLLALLTAALFCSGCAFTYGDSLLIAPRLPEEYNLLQQKLDEITAGGQAFLISADTGVDRQSVQLKDLDGDGEDEAVAFFRSREGSIQVYVFARTQAGYEQVGMAEGPGYFRWVRYPRIAQGAVQGMAVAWGQEGALTGVTVYGLGPDGLYEMLDTQYAQMTITDLGGDGVDELLLIRRMSAHDPEERYALSFFAVRDGAYKEVSTVELCKDVRSVINFSAERAAAGRTTLYVDSLAGGSGNYVTDIIAFDGIQAVNLTIDPVSGEGGLWRAQPVLSRDINGDGQIDVPVTDRADYTGEIAAVRETRSNQLIWKNIGQDGTAHDAALTYHQVADRWYLLWPAAWGERVLAESSGSVYRQTTRFYLPVAGMVEETMDELSQTVLSIYVFSGDDREQHSQMFSSVEILKETSTAIYGFSLPENPPAELALTPEDVLRLFSTIDAGYWRSEVY